MSHDAQAPDEIVSQALSSIPDTHQPRALFEFANLALFDKMDEILSKHLHPSDRNKIYDQIRDSLYSYHDDVNADAKRSQMHAIAKACTACANVEREVFPPLWNLKNPDMAMVGTLPLKPGPANKPEAYLVSSLKDVGFSSGSICYVPVVRCFPKNKSSINADNISNCTKRYLYSELNLSSPRLILSIGSIPTKLLLGEDIKITQVAGQIHWIGPWPILPISSPGFALNSERQQQEFADTLKSAYNFLYN